MALEASPLAAPGSAAAAEDSGIFRADRGARLLREQTLGSIIRNTISVYFGNWVTIGLIYILPLLPVGMLRALAASSGHEGLAAVFLLIQLFGGILVGVALIVAVSDICIGLKPNLGRAYRRGFANAGRLIGTYLLVMLFIFLGFVALVVPGFVLCAWYMFTLPVVVLEQTGGRAALRRSRELGRGLYWRNFGVYLACSLLTVFAMLVVGVVIGVSEVLLLGGSDEVLEGILGEAVNIVLYGPLSSIPLILLYYDMRARKDGYGAAQLVEDLRI
jgi:hypothetical protein